MTRQNSVVRDSLLANLGQLRHMNEFALATAMRYCEIAELKWADIDWSKKVARLHASKNGLPRDMPLAHPRSRAGSSEAWGGLDVRRGDRTRLRPVRKLKISRYAVP